MKLLGIIVLVGFFSYLEKAKGQAKETDKDLRFVTANVGSTITLRCDTQHDKFDMVEWRRNDSGVPVIMQFQKYEPNMASQYAGRVELVDKKDLQIENVGPKDQAVYLCKTMISTNEITTFERGSPIKLTVQERPSCRGTPPSFITAVVGSSTLLPCEPVGSPKPEVVWSRNDGPLPPGRYSMTDRGLGIKGIEKEDAGRYQVTLRSSAGTFAHVMELMVRTNASVRPGNYIDGIENQIARVPCGSRDIEKGASIVWTRDGADATRDPRFAIATAGTLVVNTAKRGDSGVYQCSVRSVNSDGSTVTVSHEMYLNIQYLPSILYNKEIVYVLEDTEVELPCVAVGNPEVKVYWIKGGLEVKQSPRVEITANGSLSIQNVTLNEEGIYTCAPQNKLGSGTRRDTLLTILVAPKFVKTPEELLTVGYKQNATLDCQATGKPKPNITWFPVGAKWPYGRVSESNGILTIIDSLPQDRGRYRCMVSSMAGSLIRDFVVKISSTPLKPTNVTVIGSAKDLSVRWSPGYDGGSPASFEVWYRPVDETDHSWKRHTIPYPSFSAWNITEMRHGDAYLVAVRARNSKGFGPYSDIMKFNMSSGGTSNMGGVLSDEPLSPSDMRVNVTEKGYVVTWTNLNPPGRPRYTRTVLEQREANVTSKWMIVDGEIPAWSLRFSVSSASLDVKKFYEFRMYTVAGTRKSGFTYPSKVSVGALPQPGGGKSASSSKGGDSLPAIVLGTMFGIFLLILVVSLICFLRASRRKAGRRRGKKVQFDLIRNEYPGQDDDSFDGSAFQESRNGGPKILKAISNGKKAVGGKSILRLEGYDGEEFKDLLSAEEARMGVHVVLTPNPNGDLQPDKRYLTLPNKNVASRPKGQSKKKLFKSASSPSVLVGPKSTTDCDKATDITAEEILDEEEYDISDLETDVLGQLNPRFSSMKQTKLLDSYDQFCHSTSDFGSKDVVSGTKRPYGNNGRGKDQIGKDGSLLRRITGKTEKDIEETGTIETETTLQDRGSKENMFDDSNDASSENSVTESERHGAYDVSPLPSPLDTNVEGKPKFLSPNVGMNSVDRFLSQQHAKLGPIAETRSLESYSKSSGFESGGVSQSSASDGETNILHPINPVKFKLKDLESLSDHSARSSPLIGQGRSLFPSISESGEWERPSSLTPPARFNTMSPERKHFPDLEVADNEELFDRVMDLQRRLGVDLGDSWEDLTDLKPTYNSRRPTSASYHDGYTSDVPVSKYSTKMNMYSENEKNQRCARLLREFKRRSTSDTESPTPLNDKSVRRSNSAVCDYMRTAPPKGPPYLQRSNSAGNEESALKEVVYREWLV